MNENHFVSVALSAVPFAAVMWGIAWSARFFHPRNHGLFVRASVALLAGLVLLGCGVGQIYAYRALRGVRDIEHDDAFSLTFYVEWGVVILLSIRGYYARRQESEQNSDTLKESIEANESTHRSKRRGQRIYEGD
jgi:hypothetical protein